MVGPLLQERSSTQRFVELFAMDEVLQMDLVVLERLAWAKQVELRLSIEYPLFLHNIAYAECSYLPGTVRASDSPI